MSKLSIRFRIADFILRGNLRLLVASARNDIELARKVCNAAEEQRGLHAAKVFMDRAIDALVELYEV